MGLIRDWRRRRLLRRRTVPVDAWCQLCAGVPLLSALNADERERLRLLASVFLAEKSVIGVQGVELSQNQKTLLAALATLPVLNLHVDWYDGVREIIVYPAEFVPRHEVTDEHGVVHLRHAPLSGESWVNGPVILSWPDVECSLELDGYNVVIHEFAHKLDMRSGDANGMPPLHAGMSAAEWSNAFQRAFDALNAELDAGYETVIDPYAAEEPGEFFAVISEMFFECPLDLREKYPQIYDQLEAFYRQDPVQRFTR